MEVAIYFALGVALFALIWLIANYNGFVRLRNHCVEAWAQIDTELRRRHDLIPNLVQTVKGYAQHEKEVFEQVAEARSRATSDHASEREVAADEDALGRSLGRLLVVAEDYPELKADRNFLQLQEELVITENRLQAARRFYNGNVRELNTKIEVFPSNLIAAAMSLQKRSYFEVKDVAVRAAPRVDMGDS